MRVFNILTGCNMVLIKSLKRRHIVVSLQVCHCTFLLTILALDKDHLK